MKAAEGGFEFTVNTWRGDGSPADIEAWHETVAEQNNAHITAPMGLSQPIAISVTLDGAPASASMVFVGAGLENRNLGAAPLDPSTILAPPERFDPASLPRRLAVYVWCVPPVDAIADTDIDPAMAEAMRALGYLR